MYDDVATYLEATQSEPHPLLLELEQYARKEEVPAVPRALGRLLSVIVHAMQANRVLEVGTGFGYSTLWMALALPPAGRIWTFDPDRERTDVAQAVFRRAGVDERIDVQNQDALEVLHAFPQRNLDIVFVNGDRTRFHEYLEHALAMLKLSGLAIFYDVLDERIVDRASHGDDLETLRRFNREFATHPDMDATILPMGTGVAIGARKR